MSESIDQGPRVPSSSPLTETLIQLMSQKKGHPASFRHLHREVARSLANQPEGALRAALNGLVEQGTVIGLGDEDYFLAENLEAAVERICEVVGAFHAGRPDAEGMPSGEIKARFGKGRSLRARRNIDPRLFELAMARARASGRVRDGGSGILPAGFSPSAEQRREMERLDGAVIAAVAARRYHRLGLGELARDLRLDRSRLGTILFRLQKEGRLLRYAEDRYIDAEALAGVRTALVEALSTAPSLSTRELKELLDIPRNAFIPLLEHFDAEGVTRRDGDRRMLGDGA